MWGLGERIQVNAGSGGQLYSECRVWGESGYSECGVLGRPDIVNAGSGESGYK
ncbi:unnamed protein product [Staurois parvus]|uniref:Uncharacterized protein n=1 Tax=Staurois parvus TaxID=386267 RepID=A0ABN9BYJ0_9NEOB|nr:unnamed protein product [Staurois parvus]